MEWIEAIINTSSEALETVGAMLLENGVGCFQIEDTKDLQNFLKENPFNWDYVDEELMNKTVDESLIKFYVSDNEAGKETLMSVKTSLKLLKEMDLGFSLGDLTLLINNVNDDQWLNNWKKHYKPFNVGNKVVIRPVWEEYENKENKIVFTIDPGHVFGTGLHQSTKLCIMNLEKYVNEDTVLLDLGCGSGILSIISLMLEAKSAIAVDIDPNAVDIAYENAKLNKVLLEKYCVLSGNILEDKYLIEKISVNKYDIVVANIVADVIIKIAPIVKEILKENGVFISSGIITERISDVTEALIGFGFVIEKIENLDGWVSVVARV